MPCLHFESIVELCGKNVVGSRQILDSRFRAASAFLLGFCNASWIDEGVSWLTISLQTAQGERVLGRSYATVTTTPFLSVIIQHSGHTLCRPCVIIVNAYRNVFLKIRELYSSVLSFNVHVCLCHTYIYFDNSIYDLPKELLWLINLGLTGSQLKVELKKTTFVIVSYQKAHTYLNGRLLITPGHRVITITIINTD